MRIRLSAVVLTGTGSAFLLAPALTGQAAPGSTAPETAPKAAAPARNTSVQNTSVQNTPARSAPAAPRLRTGAHGAEVKALQQRLEDLGYDPGAADGEWGAATSYAVWAFQKVNHIKPTSRTSTRFWSALAAPRTPKPLVPRGAADRAEVDVKHQLLYVYKDGRLVLTSHISSGSEQYYSSQGHTGYAHTPRGNFRVYRKASGWETSPLGTLYKANYFDGGYAIHGEPSVPLRPASHGCVRVPMSTSTIVAKLLPIGTRVYVRG
ncbi:L,D-transpeptidase family protein [Actinoallomurus iriomotensis]|uniref:Peptidoglycan-binding protein n=1 Tax=Actinoallomurus iriomotensis TaxID=478107 RepID=A0A9W6S2P7_9ACTN|nr:L,D-transpeptidase family protein [Actinoallomurus iriomotensis]GLY84542.1 peptidoglycan-binding protein [Actinoallomurus iriomotensis]